MPTIIAQKDNQGILLQTHTRQGIQNHPDRLIQRIQHRHVQASFMVCLPGIFLIQMLGSLKGSVDRIKGKVTEEVILLVSFDKGNRLFSQNLGQVPPAVPKQNSFAVDFRILNSTGGVALADNPAVMKIAMGRFMSAR